MFRFESLDIWKLAIEYVNRVYDLTDKFPNDETFGRSSQLRRAAVSIPTNIAEGSGSETVKDYSNFLNITVKSTLETVSLLKIAAERSLISESSRVRLYEDAERLVRKVRACKRSLKNRQEISSKR